MTPDYDLSNLESAQVNLWLSLHMDEICAQIAQRRAMRGATPEASAQEEASGGNRGQIAVWKHRGGIGRE